MIYQPMLEAMAAIREARRTRPVKARERKDFAKQIKNLIKTTGKLEKAKVKKIAAFLKDAENELRDAIDSLPPGKFSREMSKILKADLERNIGLFNRRAAAELGSAQNEFANLGAEFNTTIAKAQMDIVPSLLGVNPELIENAVGRSADLIRTLSQRQIGLASDVINRGVITGKSTFEVAQQLSKTFNKSLAQMEAIARTEMLGIHSQAQAAQINDMAQTSSGIEKQWISVIDERTREDHIEAHLQIVPFDMPFIVGGEKLMFPRDPDGTAGQVINCRCTHIPVFDKVEEFDSIELLSDDLPPVIDAMSGVEDIVSKQVNKSFS